MFLPWSIGGARVIDSVNAKEKPGGEGTEEVVADEVDDICGEGGD